MLFIIYSLFYSTITHYVFITVFNKCRVWTPALRVAPHIQVSKPNCFFWLVPTRALKFLCSYRKFPSISGCTCICLQLDRDDRLCFPFTLSRNVYSPSLLKFKYRNGAQRESRPEEKKATKNQHKELIYSNAQNKLALLILNIILQPQASHVTLKTTVKSVHERCWTIMLNWLFSQGFQKMQFTSPRTCSVSSAVLPWSWTISNRLFFCLSDWSLGRVNMQERVGWFFITN